MAAPILGGPAVVACPLCAVELVVVIVGGRRVALEKAELASGFAGAVAIDWETGAARRLARPGLGARRREGESLHEQHRCRGRRSP